jgi:hypothetical protein
MGRGASKHSNYRTRSGSFNEIRKKEQTHREPFPARRGPKTKGRSQRCTENPGQIKLNSPGGRAAPTNKTQKEPFNDLMTEVTFATFRLW